MRKAAKKGTRRSSRSEVIRLMRRVQRGCSQATRQRGCRSTFPSGRLSAEDGLEFTLATLPSVGGVAEGVGVTFVRFLCALAVLVGSIFSAGSFHKCSPSQMP